MTLMVHVSSSLVPSSTHVPSSLPHPVAAKSSVETTSTPYPEALRQAAVAYYRRRKQRARTEEIGTELGVSGMSLSRWSRGTAERALSFREVEVIEGYQSGSVRSVLSWFMARGECALRGCHRAI